MLVEGIGPLRGAAPETDHGTTFWRTESGFTDAGEWTARLATAYMDTGLWPLIWDFDDGPDGYYWERTDSAHVGKVTADEVLQAGYPDEVLGSFGGLAASSADTDWIVDPFAAISARPYQGSQPQRQLMLVACERPADVLAAAGWAYSTIPLAMTAAVLRSWEERFLAVPVQLEPDAFVLSIGAPPTTLEQAVLLAGELTAITQTPIWPGMLAEIAQLLLPDGSPDYSNQDLSEFSLSPTLWKIRFSEDVGPDHEALAHSRSVPIYWDI